jgi:hypothetical protein
MVGRLFLVLAIAIGLTTPALADKCTTDIKKIDAALASPKLHASQVKPIKTLRNTGARLHKAGRHADAIKTLGGAKQFLRQMGVAVN